MNIQFKNQNYKYIKNFVSKDSHRDHKIEAWQTYFYNIFHEKTSSISSRFIWLKVVEKTSILSEAIRKRDFDDATKAIARIFCWICSFCTNNESLIGINNLSDIIWFKYPYICPHCASELKRMVETSGGKIDITQITCMCKTKKIDDQTNKGIDIPSIKYFQRANKKRKPKTLDDWVEMFKFVYESRILITSMESIAFHLFEEVGEVISALRMSAEIDEIEMINNLKLTRHLLEKVTADHNEDDRVKKIFLGNKQRKTLIKLCREFSQSTIQEEIADVFSWLCALVIKITTLRVGYIEHDRRYIQSGLSPGEPELTPDLFSLLEKLVPSEKMLSSFVALEYGQGCTICKNLANNSKQCICEPSTIANGVIDKIEIKY